MATYALSTGGVNYFSLDGSGNASFLLPPTCPATATLTDQIPTLGTVDAEILAALAGVVNGTDNYFTYKSQAGKVDTSGYLFIKGTGVACTNTLTTGVETAGLGTGRIEMYNTENNNNPPVIETFKNRNGGATTQGTTIFLQRIYGRGNSGISQAASITCSQVRPLTGGGQVPSDLRFAVQNDTTGTTQVSINPATSIENNTGSLVINNVVGYWMGFGSFGLLTQSGMIRTASDRIGFVVNTAIAMNITAAGRVGIGVANPTTFQLTLSQDSAGKPTTNTWTISSDQRIKKDIVDADLTICYDNIKNLRLRRFEWDPEYYDESITKDRHSLGFIAQEVKERFPKAIQIERMKEFEFPQKDASGNALLDPSGQPIVERKFLRNFHSLNTDQIDKSHLGATQMLIKKIEELEARLAALEKSKCTCTECEMKEYVGS